MNIQEIESRNVYLAAITDEQKKKLERYEREREKEKGFQPDLELVRKLEDAESIIRRLREENSDLRRDIHHQDDARRDIDLRQDGNYHGNRSRRGNGRNRGGYRGNWFPPLHTQTFSNNGRQQQQQQSDRRDARGIFNEKPARNESRDIAGNDIAELPHLQPSNSGSNQGHQPRKGGNNYYDENKKYRTQNRNNRKL